jgi:hypothetical protein
MWAKVTQVNDVAYGFLVSSCPRLNSFHTRNMLLRIESTGKYTHHKQVKEHLRKSRVTIRSSVSEDTEERIVTLDL